MTDIPQDQVEAAARAVLETMRSEVKRSIFNDVGVAQVIAIAAIRVLTPMIAAVERERCAQIAEDHAGDVSSMCVSRIAESIRSIKGAVT